MRSLLYGMVIPLPIDNMNRTLCAKPISLGGMVQAADKRTEPATNTSQRIG